MLRFMRSPIMGTYPYQRLASWHIFVTGGGGSSTPGAMALSYPAKVIQLALILSPISIHSSAILDRIREFFSTFCG